MGSQGLLLTLLSLLGLLAGAYGAVDKLYLFGDELLDTGTNKYLKGANYSCNFLPYGSALSVPPTGRCSNGLIISDLLAAQLKLVPTPKPYLSGQSSTTGYNFASAAAGVFPDTTAITGAVQFSTQLDQFDKYLLAHPQTAVNTSMFVVSVGSQDYITRMVKFGPSGVVGARQRYASRINACVHGISVGVERLLKKGARKIVVFGVEPLGCVPWVRYNLRLFSGCIPQFNSVAASHNVALRSAMGFLRNKYKAKISVFNTDVAMRDPRSGYPSYRFPYDCNCKAVILPSFSGGVYQLVQCGRRQLYPNGANGSLSPLSATAYVGFESKYFWWDFYTPTQPAQLSLFNRLWNGNGTYVYPTNAGSIAAS